MAALVFQAYQFSAEMYHDAAGSTSNEDLVQTCQLKNNRIEPK